MQSHIISPLVDSDRELLLCFEHLLAERLGLHFPPLRWPEMARQLRRVAQDLGLASLAGLLPLLEQRVWPDDVRKKLAQHLTVGETYFFRDPSLFHYLSDHFLQPLLARRRDSNCRWLRIWSAGCCSGEEAYSLAMLVRQLLPDVQGWRIDILGTDINPLFLEQAQLGHYRSWSLRQLDSSIRERFFTGSDHHGWQIDSSLRDSVVFRELNLVEPVYPDPTKGMSEFDLILCRNVLMYFEPGQIKQVLKRLQSCLCESGILLLAPVEAGLCQEAGWRSESRPGAIAVLPRPAEESPRILNKVAVAADLPSEGEPIDRSLLFQSAPADLRTFSKTRIRGSEQMQQQVGQTLEVVLQQARDLADCGDLEGATEQLQQAQVLNKLDPRSYWLQALLEWEGGRLQPASQLLHKVLYLDPHFVLAHYLSGHIAVGLQKPELARRHYDNCLRLLADLPDDQILPEAGDASVAQCREWLLVSRSTLKSRCSV